MPNPAKTVTKKAVAEAAGVSVSTLDRAIENGVVPEGWLHRTPGGFAKVLRTHVQDVVAALSASGAQKSQKSDLTPRAERDFYEARLAEVKLKRELKELIPTQEVEREVTGAFSKLATRLLQMPAQLAAELHAAETVHAVETLLEAALRERFADFRAEVCGQVVHNGLDDGDLNGSATPSDSSLN